MRGFAGKLHLISTLLYYNMYSDIIAVSKMLYIVEKEDE
jgi:hypothetical protein